EPRRLRTDFQEGRGTDSEGIETETRGGGRKAGRDDRQITTHDNDGRKWVRPGGWFMARATAEQQPQSATGTTLIVMVGLSIAFLLFMAFLNVVKTGNI